MAKQQERNLFIELRDYITTKEAVLKNEHSGIELLPFMNEKNGKFKLTKKEKRRLKDIRIQLNLIQEFLICIPPISNK